jgi:hypothetical protein
MGDSKEFLQRFASSKSMFFDLPDGEERKVTFLSAEEIPNKFDGGQSTCVRYHLKVDDKEKLWDRVSRELAQEMAKISEGDTIFIQRTGQKNKTKYFIRKVKE